MKKLLINSVYCLCVCCMAILMPFGLTSCSNDEFAEYKYDDWGIKSFTSFTATLNDVAGTRAYLDGEASNGIRRVHWEQGDIISVFSDTDLTLKEFVLTGIDEKGVGTFTGKGVSGNKFYAVFAPGKEITVDASDPNVIHLKGAVFNKNMMADQGTDANFAAPMVATTTGSSFSFKQTTGLVKITVGNVHQVDDLFFRGSKLEPIGEKYLVDMSNDQPVLKLDEGANIVSFDQIITDLDDKFVDVYFTLPPMEFENGFLLTITGVDAKGKEFEIDKSYTSRFEVKAGSISSFSLVDIGAELEAQVSEIIEFADPIAKQICVENWDTNGDGELSYAEAVKVTDIGVVFEFNRDIKSFDEFKYFTGVTTIGRFAFYGCSSLTSIEIPEVVTSILASAFSGCSSLTSVIIPESVTSMQGGAFQDCTSLTSIEIPEGVASIVGNPFMGCSSLTSIKVNKNNGYYDSRDDCNAIIETKSNTLVSGCVSTIIPDNVKSIGHNAFYGCSSLTSIVIPEGVTSFGTAVFSYCSSLTSIVIPDGVTSIGASSFYGCSSLASIVIPDGVTSIENNAFEKCSSLTKIVLPKGVTSIGKYAFMRCSNLTSIEIPNGVTSIGEGALMFCYSLDSIELPDGVTSIGVQAFSGCSSLTSFTCLATNPPTLGGSAFNGMNGSIYVPEGYVDAYKAADGWKDYASQIQAIPA